MTREKPPEPGAQEQHPGSLALAVASCAERLNTCFILVPLIRPRYLIRWRSRGSYGQKLSGLRAQAAGQLAVSIVCITNSASESKLGETETENGKPQDANKRGQR